jgi:hypothetical protein
LHEVRGVKAPRRGLLLHRDVRLSHASYLIGSANQTKLGGSERRNAELRIVRSDHLGASDSEPSSPIICQASQEHVRDNRQHQEN